MNNKNQEHYDFCLKLIKILAKKNNFIINPKFIISDFELSEINALKFSFPNSTFIGCWFHYSKSIQDWFNTQKPGYKKQKTLEANIIKSHITCLPWVPPQFVLYYWENN